MTPLGVLVFGGGLIHLGILVASALVPCVLAWNRELAKLDVLTRQLVWVHGLFIVLVIAGFGILSVLCAEDLAAGSRVARAVCGLIAMFWFTRLVIQFTVLDAKPYLRNPFLKMGYHGLTLAFTYLAGVYTWAAVSPPLG